jgi:phosphoribosyl 1,2-cyclic phosphate phosphodiesterase
MTLEVVILGCGSSGGVPRANGDWGACDPANPKNRRSRCSLAVRRQGPHGLTTAIVDTSPDLRTQMLAAGITHIDGVVLTHDHADQTHGIDDLRTFAYMGRKRVPVWLDAATNATLDTRFGYIFRGEHGYPPICDAHVIAAGDSLTVDGAGGSIDILTFAQRHGPIASLGYRFGPIAYSSDVSGLSPEVLEGLEGVDLWIVDALRWTRHPTHANVDQALAWIAEARVERAVLTNLHIDLDYDRLGRLLPGNVEVAYDGWRGTFEA